MHESKTDPFKNLLLYKLYMDENYIIESAIELKPNSIIIPTNRLLFSFWDDGFTYLACEGDHFFKISSTYEDFLKFHNK
jgi:hypothetical protein